MWPYFDAVGKRSSNLYADFKQGLDITKYATTGQEDRKANGLNKKRSDSPGKTQGTTIGSKGGNWKGS